MPVHRVTGTAVAGCYDILQIDTVDRGQFLTNDTLCSEHNNSFRN